MSSTSCNAKWAIAMLLVGVSGGTLAVCPDRGEKVRYEQVEDVYKELRPLTEEGMKDEFETDEEWRARTRELKNRGVGARERILEGTLDRDSVRYNAEKEELEIQKYAWANQGVAWHKLCWGEVCEIEVPILGGRGLELRKEEETTGSYEAVTGGGANIEVVEVTRRSFAVFGGLLPEGESSWSWGWNTDRTFGRKGKFSSVVMEIGGTTAPVPRKEARKVKEGMRVGLVIELSPPFTVYGEVEWPARFSNPTRTRQQVYAVVGAIRCAVVTDGEGTVIASVKGKETRWE